MTYVILHFGIPGVLSFSETGRHNLGLSWFYAVSTKNGGVITIKIFYNKLLLSDKMHMLGYIHIYRPILLFYILRVGESMI